MGAARMGQPGCTGRLGLAVQHVQMVSRLRVDVVHSRFHVPKVRAILLEMTHEDSSRLPSRWADAGQAALLLDVGLRPALNALMVAPLSAGELAKKLDVNIQRAHYLIGKFERAGLAELDSVQPRAGRAIRRWRIHPDWYVPFDVTQAASLTELVQGQLVPRMAAFSGLLVRQLYGLQQVWGFRVWHNQSAVNMSLLAPDGTTPFDGPPILANLGSLSLTPDRARALQARLMAVMDEFQDASLAESRTYTAGLLLVEGEVG